MKICSTCKVLKPLDNFYRDKRAKDGLHSQCKECEKKYEKNRDRNKKRVSAKRYRESHKAIEKARLQRWKKNNPEKYREYHTQKKLKNRCTVPYFDNDITLEKLYNLADGVCALCGGICDYEDYIFKGKYFIAGNKYPSIDHIVPLSKGGSHTWDNVQLAHKQCNSIKSNKSPEEASFLYEKNKAI